MLNDDKFKALMIKGAVEETSQYFTDETMRKIERGFAAKKYQQPLIKHSVKLAFIIAFAVVLSALLAISIFIQPSHLPFNLYITIPPIRIEDFYNVVYFIIIFWLVMFLNHKIANYN